jgi:hypothetical protein
VNENKYTSTSYYCRIFSLALLSLVFISVPAMAESQFTHGFREIGWGTHKDQLPDLGLKPGALANIYKTGHSSAFLMAGAGKLAMELEGVPLLTIFLNFFDQRLYGADLIFDRQHRQQIHAILVKDTGMTGVKTEKGDQWQTETLSIILTEHEVIIVSEAHNPEKSSSALAPADKDAACCQGKG